MEVETDGYGVSFPVHTQMFHCRAVLEALGRNEVEKLILQLPPVQCEWKDLSAGHWDKTPKNNLSLDG